MASTFGALFRVTTFGESHGVGVGVVIDGCPAGLPLSEADIQRELDRRRPGQSSLVSQRKEPDVAALLSGVDSGVTVGTPITIVVRNEDARPRDYDEFRQKYRPSHADYTYHEKYGVPPLSGGGRASARETLGRVAAGAVAAKLLSALFGVEVIAWVSQVYGIESEVDPLTLTRDKIEANPVRCPDPDAALQMIEAIEHARKEGDSLGGVVGCVAQHVPAGWGEPVFDKLEADLAKAALSIPACKGFEIGSGFAGTHLRGSEHNDPFYADDERRVYTSTNFSGGVQGGISNGMPILMRLAFKPTSTILKEQHTVTIQKENTTLKGKGRHDPCVLPRAVPVVEAMVNLVLADHALRQASTLTFSQQLGRVSSGG
ncbi:MAG: chorismate synthase [Fimbriimonadaceae bacterium]|nr:Chorismate synthase [Fimbriimonadaceae bacterium]MCL4285933.1 chorismate synthase [Fimbriimonadaceae bacterium]QOJ12430.1 MAG: chorismate synthase [Chthonomonadaceae bacterium]